ncbi:hypothetical protein G9C98_000713 [Cotesia typhae]|uniref:Lipase n=1 Tax=Cotesia typhae TaxID=2053667 RepID=A0A8J5VB63_9HYME|nr:hypothetical protein G9C98_000713 [Cotesia typhae]
MIFRFGIVCLALSLGTNAFTVRINYPQLTKFDVSKDIFGYSEDANLNARELIRKYGYRGETHKVITHDDYILEMHRITGPNSNPNPENKTAILLMHGLLSSSVDWIISGPQKALAYMLADEGYDVWLGNARGNRYSRSHKILSVLDKQFWQFSWNEIGVYDLPAMIDYILDNTGSQKIFYAAHSQGTTAFFVMCSTKPEYNDKIIAMSALAPVAYIGHMTSPFFQILARLAPMIETGMNLLGMYEFQPTEKFMKYLKTMICDPEAWSQPICENAIFLVAGFGSDQMNSTLLPAILGHIPAGSSTKQFFHYSQIIKSSNVKDVEILAEQLPNVHAKIKVPHPTFGHLDYIWGIHANELLYEKILDIMNFFSQK